MIRAVAYAALALTSAVILLALCHAAARGDQNGDQP